MYWLMVCNIQLSWAEDWMLMESWFPLYYIHGDSWATGFVATEDESEVMTVILQAQFLVGAVYLLSEDEFGRALEACASGPPSYPAEPNVITARSWKNVLRNRLERSAASDLIISHTSRNLVEETSSEQDTDVEPDLSSFSDSDDDSDYDSAEDSEDESECEDPSLYSADGPERDEGKSERMETVDWAIVDSISLAIHEGFGIPASSCTGALL